MSREAGSFTIDDVKYHFSMLSPREAQKIIVRLAKITAPAFADGIVQYQKTKNIEDIDLGNIFEVTFPLMNEDELEQTTDTLLVCAGTEGMDDQRFQGKLPHMYKVLFKSFEVNFSDFLDMMGVERSNAQPGTIPEK